MLKLGMDIAVEALYETLSLFPYLYLTYLLMEALEHQLARRSQIYIRRAKKYGSIIGGLLGIIPQCGFSIAAANLYATGLITLGALMAVFLSTSDEMLPLLLSNNISLSLILQIIAIKALFGITAGIAIDKWLPETFIRHKNEPNIQAFCQREKCQCKDKENIWISAFKHTERILIFIFICSILINTLLHLGGKETISDALASAPFLSIMISAVVGLIPSCYPSVLLTQLYIEQTIGLGTMLAGTLSNAGLGFLVLYRVNVSKKESLKILALLFGLGIFFGIIAEILF